MSGFLWLTAALGALVASSALAAACLRLRSPTAFALAAYVLGWTWLVAMVLALSPLELVTRGWLSLGFAAALVGTFAIWRRMDSPRPPAFGPALAELRRALACHSLLVLAVVVAGAALYSVALALLTPANDGDALAYHLARAAFWKQEHGLGYIAGVEDLRLDVNPPNAEIGQLVTMLLSGGDRYVALPALVAYPVLLLCVTALGRHVGLDPTRALFGALAFASLSVVALQASSAVNDIVVASFLAVAAVFALRPGRVSLVLAALALGLAVGTKFTALLALPALALVVALGRPPRHWPGLAVAGLGGLVLGSTWYVVNVVETGMLDGGLADASDQRVEASASAVLTNGFQLALDVLDMSGAARPHWWTFVAVGGALVVVGLVRLARSSRDGLAFVGAGVVTVGVLTTIPIDALGQRALEKAWAVFGKPELGVFESSLDLNYAADAVASGFGALGALILVGSPLVVLATRRRKQVPAVALAFAFAPWVLVLTLAVTVVWDPFRARFVIFAAALAAATWGFVAGSAIMRRATAAIGATAVALTLANHQGKPSGLAEIWPRDPIGFVSVESIWSSSRADALARVRPDEGEEAVYELLEENVAADARIAVATQGNDFLSPYFGPRLTRHVSLASRTVDVPEDAAWLFLAPGTDARRCRSDWRREVTLGSGWRIERRVADDGCR